MKKQTRNNIGAILIWSGLIAFAAQIGYLIYTGLKLSDTTMLNTGLWNIPVILAILIGGLWGMRK
jgi:hypothetical protein